MVIAGALRVPKDETLCVRILSRVSSYHIFLFFSFLVFSCLVLFPFCHPFDFLRPYSEEIHFEERRMVVRYPPLGGADFRS